MKLLLAIGVMFLSFQSLTSESVASAWTSDDFDEPVAIEEYDEDDFTYTPPATERAAAIVSKAQASIGRYVGGRDCYSFVRSIANGNLGKVIGTFSNAKSSIELSPGQIVHMQNFNLAGISGSNHWAMIETVRSDGRITILHQNLAGRPVTRSVFRKSQMRGYFKIYQP